MNMELPLLISMEGPENVLKKVVPSIIPVPSVMMESMQWAWY